MPRILFQTPRLIFRGKVSRISTRGISTRLTAKTARFYFFFLFNKNAQLFCPGCLRVALRESELRTSDEGLPIFELANSVSHIFVLFACIKGFAIDNADVDFRNNVIGKN